ncbi:DUF1345 domain-containing protein [uncultured Amaricoccus sp.]|uniref:DUF1345 domain-containing protein n=1 Tax=uncultured Amaricoccus sp. TaxID=339341 RepID=UPI00260BD9DC|nr:DUF1345 domain-containing protein [uncultured Amaricoccus sp.]
MHLHRHGRFYLALAAAVAVFLIARLLAPGADPEFRALLAGDVFFGVFLALMAFFAYRVDPEGLRRRAAVEDEGWPLILALTAAAAGFGLASTFVVINSGQEKSAGVLFLAMASVPVSWAMVHTLAAFHYANLYYARGGDGDAAGLEFPGGDEEPGMLEFLYYSFVVGMTAQVSDVSVASHAQRKATLTHGIASFFYNTVLIALAVNAAISIAG